MARLKQIEESLEDYSITGNDPEFSQMIISEIKQNLKRLEIMKLSNSELRTALLVEIESQIYKNQDISYALIKNYLAIILHESSISDLNYQKILYVIDSKSSKTSGLSLNAKLYKISRDVIKLLINRTCKLSNVSSPHKICEIFERILNRAGISRANLKSYLLTVLSSSSLDHTIDIFFSSPSVFYSQYLRGICEQVYLPSPGANIPDLSITMLRVFSSRKDEAYHCSVTSKGFLHSDVYSQDGLTFIGSFYEGMLENDIYLELNRENLYRLLIISRSDGYYIQTIQSVYGFMSNGEQNTKSRNGFRAYSIMKQEELVVLDLKDYVRIGEFIEFYIKNIDIERKTLHVKHTAGYLQSKVMKYSIEDAIIGDSAADIQYIGDNTVAKHHARLYIEGSNVMLLNLASEQYITGVFKGWTDSLLKLEENSIIVAHDQSKNSRMYFELIIKYSSAPIK